MTDKALSFFRLFDLAFFVPGGVLYAALAYGCFTCCSSCSEPLTPPSSLTDLSGLAFVLASLGAVYLLGLILHGLQRFLIYLKPAKYLRKKAYPTASRSTWYSHLNRDRREELALYFWYLRATCWNTALAIPISLLILWQAGCSGRSMRWLITLGLLATTILTYAGWDFERAFRTFQRAAKKRGER